MPDPLAHYLRAAHQHFFVGREQESRLFREAVTAERMPFHVLYMWGPGGVGKTALTLLFRETCESCGVPFFRLEARDLEPVAAAFVDALERVLGENKSRRTLADAAQDVDRLVLVVDTYETLASLDRWMCEDFLPSMPDNVLLVLSGRNRRSSEWRSNLGLQRLVHPLPLRNLRAEESRLMLDQRGVPQPQHEAVLSFAKGHPLALSLIADAFDQQPGIQFMPERTPDVVGTLLKRFLSAPLTLAQRAAVELCALVRYTTQPLLADVLKPDDSRTLFEWLRGLSFIEADGHGLYPHDLVREVLATDLRWRDPETYSKLQQRVRQLYTEQLAHPATARYEHILTDYLYLNRHNPVVRPFFQQLRQQWRPHGTWSQDQQREDDLPVLRDALARHEGETAATLFEAWATQHPEGLHVVRRADGKPAGALFRLVLETTSAGKQDTPDDPAVAAAHTYLRTQAPLRQGERALLFRFWFSCAEYQAISPVQSLLFVQTVRHYLQTPGLAFSFLPCAKPAYWQLALNYADLEHLPEADFTIDGRTYGMFGHDWRVRPPVQWLDTLARRGNTLQRGGAPSSRDELLVLSEPDFAEAVKEALQVFLQLDQLRNNPLVRSRLVLDRITDDPDYGDRARVLQHLIYDVAESLNVSPREAKFYQALHATYLDPAPTQERAAEKLGLPFSTYRRYLKSGIDGLTQALWQREIRG